MTQRLSKLAEYLYNNNFEMAVEFHEKSRDPRKSVEEPEEVQLLLAKAYFLNKNYNTAIDLASKLKGSRQMKIVYQSHLVEFKAFYMNGQMKPEPLRNLLMRLRKEGVQNVNRLSKQIEEILALCEKGSNFMDTAGKSTVNMNSERRDFDRIIKQEDDRSIIMDGMPMFLISKAWFESWKDYTSPGDKFQRERRHPGPITQFDLIDHIYNIFFDSRSSKDYTNRFVFPSSEYEIVPKKAWLNLKQKYGGIEIKRFNNSFIDKPHEIFTQVHLKRIQIAKVDKTKSLNKFHVWVQITKKQNWEGLKNKLACTWGNGFIYTDEVSRKKVSGGDIFEEIDTIGKSYLFIINVKDEDVARDSSNESTCHYKKCGKTQNLKLCQCKTVKYCDINCLKNDWKNHRARCETEQEHINRKPATFKEFNLEEKDYGGCKGVVGLKNLGNTCYMNSGLQCLSNTKELTDYFMRDQFKNHINHTNPLGTKGNLACAYAQLVREMWTGSSDALAPTRLKKKIGEFATQFSGYGQQDSQQFISYLIDGIQQDLNIVKKKESFQVGDDIKPDHQMSKQRQFNDSKRIQSFIRSLMTGQFKSTVVCGSCGKVSVCFDPYMLISLPIPTSKDTNFYFVPSLLTKGALKLSMDYNSSTSMRSISKQFCKVYNDNYYRDIREAARQGAHHEKMLFLTLDSEKFIILNIYEPDDKISNISAKDILFFLQIPSVKKDEALLLCEFQIEKERCSYPRFVKYSKAAGVNGREQAIYQALRRGLEKSAKSAYSQLVVSQRPSTLKNYPFEGVIVQYRRKLKLSTFLEGYHEGFNRKIYEDDNSTMSLSDCFKSYALKERLQKENTVYCSKCKDHKEATKQMQIYKTNKILVLAFKRFNRHRKITIPVDFPLEGLDIGPYVLSNTKNEPILYDLYGVVNHHGSLYGGHYTAYCQNFLDKKWYEFNDSRVSSIGRKQVASAYSYVLFYRKRQK